MKKRLLCLITCIIITLVGCSFDTKELNDADNQIEIEENESVPTSASNDTCNLFSIDQVGDYTGNPYAVINDNVPYFSDEDKTSQDSFEYYSDLDYLGRCGVAYANICSEIMPTEPRGEIGSVKPSGWHTINYHEYIDGNYLYNRCHLIGYQLSGENANEKNLITGTRYLNVDGMLPFEIKVADYVESTGNHVLYRVTPIFENDNFVASGVLMEAYSVEDQGEGVEFNVYCYNVQPGIDIDYATGDSKLSSDALPVINQETAEQTYSNEELEYVININTKKFHHPECSSVNDMKENNKQYFYGSSEELINQGYSPCQRCCK